MLKYKINTYGCQMNVHESEKIAAVLRKFGYLKEDSEDYDIVVFNTCCIRDNAEKKILGHIGAVKKIKEKKPDLIIIVMGCMTQQKGAATGLLKRFPMIDIILGANNLNDLESELARLKRNEFKHEIKIDESDKPQVYEFDEPYRTSGVNAWVNIMYGCNNFCSYCIVPHVRGRERSRNPEKILNEIRRLVADGYKEITLLGQNVDSYGSDFDNSYGFANLLDDIEKIDGNYRLRFMTSHPKDITLDVINRIKNSTKLCHYVHLPLQSGSNNILKAMNRKYTRERYLELIDMIRSNIPDVGITTDLMVGFPGETEADFEDTLDMVKRACFSASFTYIYSPRAGTPASTMEQIPYAVKSERIQRLIKLQNELTKERSREYEGKVFKVLIEDYLGDGRGCGRTDCGRLVNFPCNESDIGRFVMVKIEKSRSASLFGEIVE